MLLPRKRIRDLIIKKTLYVRQVEELVKKRKPARPSKKKRSEQDSYLNSLAENLKRSLGTKVDIKKGKKQIDLIGLSRVLSQLKSQNVETLILGCTELPVAFQMFNIKENYMDPTQILARSAIEFLGEKVIDDVKNVEEG